MKDGGCVVHQLFVRCEQAARSVLNVVAGPKVFMKCNTLIDRKQNEGPKEESYSIGGRDTKVQIELRI
jgi:hypothetical protein